MKAIRYYAYVLQSTSSGKYYTGHTSDLDRRLVEHNSGRSSYTSGRGPWKLIYHESFASRSEAMKKEKYLKTGKGREFINSLQSI